MSGNFPGWCRPLRAWVVTPGVLSPLVRTPEISSGFGPRELNTYSGGWHLGVDWSMRWRQGDPISGPLAVTRIAKGRRFGYVTPSNTLVVACGPGEVIQSKRNSRGWGVAIDHHNTVITWYQHLIYPSGAPPVRGDVVAAGDALGWAGWDTTVEKESGKPGFRHLHWAWLFRSQKYKAATSFHDMGKRLGLGFRAIALDPERFVSQLAQLTTTEPIRW